MKRRHLLHVVALLALSLPANAQPTTAPAAADHGAERYRLISRPDEVVAVLNNGATVICKRVASPVVAVRGYVRTGGAFEGKWLGGGLSHLLEHLVAGGSTERRTEAENRNLLQQIGNNSNAYTSDDATAYYINTTPQHYEQAIDLITGWLLGATITPDEYAREYQVVQRELEMGKGSPDRQFYHLANALRYRVSPARVPVIGYQEVIRGLSRDDVYAYYKLAYQPQNFVFSVAGDVDPEAMLAAFRKHLAAAAPGREFDHDLPAEPAVVTPRTVVATFPKLGQAKVQIGFPTVRLDSPDLYALDLLSAVLSSGDSAVLTEELRDRRQLVSEITSYSHTPDYVEGTFAVQFECDADKVQAATDAALKVLTDVRRAGVDADRLARAKTQMKVARVRGLQTAEEIASSLANDFMTTGDPHFTDTYLGRIAGVTVDEVRAVAAKYFAAERLLTTVMLPAAAAPRGLPQAVDLIRPVSPTTVPGAGAAQGPAQVVRSELDDGTVLLVKRITASPLVSVRMYATGGVTAESAETNGLGHLTMEMLPRGTAARSAQQIAQTLDDLGAELETASGSNTWQWSTSCLKADLPKVMDVWADVLGHPAFADAELAPMKARVTAAIEGQDAEWTGQAFRFFRKTYFGRRNVPYQFDPKGSAANVAAFSAQQLGDWYRAKVLAAPRVLAIYGDVEPEAARALATTALAAAGVPKVAPPKPPTFPETPDVSIAVDPMADVTRVELNKTEQALAGVVIGYQSESVYGHPWAARVDVADTLTSGYGFPTGYLHETLRGRGLVYMVHGQNFAGRDASVPGTFFVMAGCEPAKVNDVVDAILLNVARLQADDAAINPDWFARAKQLIPIDEAMNTQTPADQAEQAALAELYGVGHAWPATLSDRVAAVTIQDVRQLAQTRLRRCVVTVSTPRPELVQIETGPRQYQSFPPVDLTPKGVQHDAPAGR